MVDGKIKNKKYAQKIGKEENQTYRMWISILKRWIKRFFIKNIVNEPKEISLPFEPELSCPALTINVQLVIIEIYVRVKKSSLRKERAFY